jgi:hypothetical protein
MPPLQGSISFPDTLGLTPQALLFRPCRAPLLPAFNGVDSPPLPEITLSQLRQQSGNLVYKGTKNNIESFSLPLFGRRSSLTRSLLLFDEKDGNIVFKNHLPVGGCPRTRQ